MSFVKCPHCNGEVEIEAINCGIFRHAILLSGKQLSPHASQESCEKALQEGAVGCAKPFRVKQTAEGLVAETCGYI